MFSERKLKATFPDRNSKLAMDQKSLLDMDFSELNKFFEDDRWKKTPGGTADFIMVRYNSFLQQSTQQFFRDSKICPGRRTAKAAIKKETG